MPGLHLILCHDLDHGESAMLFLILGSMGKELFYLCSALLCWVLGLSVPNTGLSTGLLVISAILLIAGVISLMLVYIDKEQS